jgi:drug/metabolite transporter (DMT)-like permease
MRNPKHVRACLWLLGATAVWGLSFPFIRATWLLQEKEAGVSSVFFAAALTVIRFGVAAILMALFSIRTLRALTKLELHQGIGLGIFGGLGILFQMDGLAHTSASTSAFLTQFYCLVIPIWVAWRKRALPKLAVIVSSLMVLSGVAVLSRFNWSEFALSHWRSWQSSVGEAETIVAAIFFAGQILWLERPVYAPNRVTHFTVIMFTTIAVLILPVAIWACPRGAPLIQTYFSGPSLALMAVITFACTLGCYTVMNVWQPHVTATEAGLIYCIEPLCASLFALALPGWISGFANINYPNEPVTIHLLVGGGLITAANVLIQIEATLTARRRSSHSPG